MSDLIQTMVNSVREFMTNFEQAIYKDIQNVPCEVCVLRSNLIREEAREYEEALVRTEDELDAICDLLYVVIGTNLALATPTHSYRSGQLRCMSGHKKQSIIYQVLPMLQDLDCQFPCTRIQTATSNALVSRLIDVANIVGYDLQGAFNEVHRSNMTKLWPSTPLGVVSICGQTIDNYKATPKGVLIKRADGKIIKPPTFVAPSLERFL